MRPRRDVDVVVVGSGAAGLAAALSARENGAQNVLIAESEGLVGGSSRLSGGLMMGAGTRYQRKLGIADDAGSLFHDYMQLNQWKVESAVVRRLAELAGRRWNGSAISGWSSTTSWCSAVTSACRGCTARSGAARR